MKVHGIDVNERTQCAHYHSERDIVAIQFKCCDTFYACASCHEALAGHDAQVWSKEERDVQAVLCGNCRRTLSIGGYLSDGNSCPHCGAPFNPRCVEHYHFYFEM